MMRPNGNAVTVSGDLYQRMEDAGPEAMEQRPLTARALKKVIGADRAACLSPTTFAAVFPVSTHKLPAALPDGGGRQEPPRRRAPGAPLELGAAYRRRAL